MKRIVSLLLAALTLSAAGCSKAPEALDMPSKIQSPVEQALPESGKRLDEIALPEAQTRQDQPVVTDQAEPEPDQAGAAAAEHAEPPAEDPITMEGKDMQITFDRLPDTLEEFSALCNDLTKPENTCALFLLALNLYTKDKAAGEKAIDMLRGPRPMTGIDSQFIRDRLRDKKYLPLAYFDGATPAVCFKLLPRPAAPGLRGGVHEAVFKDGGRRRCPAHQAQAEGGQLVSLGVFQHTHRHSRPRRRGSLGMRRVVLLALCAMLLCGCARNNDLADAIASSISVSTPRPTIRPLGKPTAEPKPATEPEAESEPEPEAYTEEGALYLVSLYGEDEDAFELKLRPVFSLSDEDIEESMELYGITYDDFFASEGIVVCPNEEVFHTATVLKDSNAVFALVDWESDEPWNEHILLTAEKFLAYMRMMEEDGNSLLASVTTLSGMVTGLEQLYVP